MITFGPTRRLLKLSTPWQSSGVLFEDFSHRLDRDDILVWQAATSTMNPRIDLKELERERLADPSYYAREFEALFVSDLEAFLPGADIRAATQAWSELPPSPEPFYIASIDASGLSGGDRFCFGVAHSDRDGKQVVDLLRGWKRGSVAAVVDEIVNVCAAFRIRTITADQYSFSFLAELFRQRDVQLEQLAFSTRSKPECFFDLKGALSQGALLLPNHDEMLRELRALESTRTSGGQYKISAPRGAHDDFACVLALLANKIKRSRPHDSIITFIEFADRPPDDFAPRTEEDLRSSSREEYFFRTRRSSFG